MSEPLRSKLFVPATRPEFFPKALAGDADAICIDLEDAVAEDRKDEARDEAVALLAQAVNQGTDKTIIVRVNGCGTPHHEADIAAIARPGLDMVSLPKIETGQEVRDVAARLKEAASANGLNGEPLLQPAIESPLGLRNVAEIACGHPSVAGLQFGLADLFEPLQIDRDDHAAVHYVQMQIRMAAGEAGVHAYDTVYADFRDPEGFKREAGASKALGFVGKSCIHPSQVALANATYAPTPEEIARANRIIEGAREAEAQGLGAFNMDGEMIDGPFVRRAEAVLAAAQRYGLSG